MSIETPTSDVVFGAIAAKFSASIVHPSGASSAGTAALASYCGNAVTADVVSVIATAGSWLPSASSAAWAGYAATARVHPATHTSGGVTVSHARAGFASTVELYASEAGEVGSAKWLPNRSWVESGATHWFSAGYAATGGLVSSAGTVGSALLIPRYKTVDGINIFLSADMAASAVFVSSALAVNSARYVPSGYSSGGSTVHPVVPHAATAGSVAKALAVNSAGYVMSSAKSDGVTIKPVVPYALSARRATSAASAASCSRAGRILDYAHTAGTAAVAGPECIDPVVAALSAGTLDRAWAQTVSGAKTFSGGIVVSETQDGSFVVPLSQVSAVISGALEAYASAHGL